MTGGISFCGVDIQTLGMEYVPNQGKMFVWQPKWQNKDAQFQSADGGVYYGSRIAAKQFQLQLVILDTTPFNIDKIFAHFKRGKYGPLVFSRRPHLTYMARVTNIQLTPLRGFKCAYVDITFVAYYPFATTKSRYYPFDSQRPYDERGRYVQMDSIIKQTTALLTQAKTPHITHTFARLQQGVQIPLYNGGSQRAPVAIKISGYVGSGITITNTDNETSCGFVGVTNALTMNGKYVCANAYDGKTSLVNGNEATLAYKYHTDGYLMLQPAFPIQRDVIIDCAGNSNRISSSNYEFTLEDLNKQLYYLGAWHKIIDVDSGDAIMNYTATQAVQGVVTQLITMNHITIVPQDMFSGTITFEYLPTFS